MDTRHLISLVDRLSAHIGRSEMTIAKRAGVHTRLVLRLRAGGGCNVGSFTKIMAWLDENWPSDLEWPTDVPRPSLKDRKSRAA
jgi:hypothetical protein